MSNPLIETAPDTPTFSNFSSEDNKWAEGAGIFQDAANTITDAAEGNWGSLALDVAGDGLNALGFIQDPFGVLLAAPIGWIIEHIGFLKDTLDLVAGDPDDVRAKAQTWTNIAAALDKSAADYEASAKALTGKFAGAAADAYTKAALNYCKTVKGASAQATEASKAFEVAGVIVGTVRGAIRDMFAQFAADALITGLAALASSVPTFGASIAAWTSTTVLRGISIAERAAAKITKAVRQVSELARGAGRSSAKLREVERMLKNGPARRAAAKTATRKATRDVHSAESKADAATTRIQSAQEAQVRARQHLDEATTPAQREAAQNELHNARQRELRHRGNYAEAQRDLAKAKKAEHDGRRDQYRGAKLTKEQEEKLEQIEKAKGRIDKGKEIYDNVTDDEKHDKSDKATGKVNNGSLVDSDE